MSLKSHALAHSLLALSFAGAAHMRILSSIVPWLHQPLKLHTMQLCQHPSQRLHQACLRQQLALGSPLLPFTRRIHVQPAATALLLILQVPLLLQQLVSLQAQAGLMD